MNWDCSLFSDDDYLARFKTLRDDQPVHLHQGHAQYGNFWNLTRYEDLLAADLDPERFRAGDSFLLADAAKDFPLPMFLSMNDPRHRMYRDAVQPFFSNSHIDTLEAEVRRNVADILSTLPLGEPFDWVSSVSIELTSRMLALLIGFPVDRRRELIHWSDLALIDPTSEADRSLPWEQRQPEFMRFYSAMQALRGRQSEGPDLVRMLDRAEGSERLKPSDFLGNLLMLIVAGNDTTRNSISGAVVAFDSFPGQYQLLRRDPSKMGGAVREVFRWQTPIAYMRREAAVDMQLRDRHIHAGDKVVLWYASGNQDERVFPEPARFDIERESSRRSLAFGFGIHRCLGVRLAELQLRVLLEELVTRYSTIRLAAAPVRIPSMFIRGYRELMVVLQQ